MLSQTHQNQVNYSTNLLFLPFCITRIFLHHIHVLSIDLFTPVFTVWVPFAFAYFYFKNFNGNDVLLLCHIHLHPKNSPLVVPE